MNIGLIGSGEENMHYAKPSSQNLLINNLLSRNAGTSSIATNV